MNTIIGARLLSIAVLIFAAAPTAFATISGTVFRDYNADGSRAALEPGVAGVTVEVFDSTGASIGSATSLDDGGYAIAVTLAGSAPFRVEFTGLPALLEEGVFGADSGTSVFFGTADGSGNATGLDFGVQNPAEHCEPDPLVFTPCYAAFDRNGSFSAEPASVAIPYTSNSQTPTKTHMVSASQLGATYGVAWQVNSGRLFASSFIKTGTGLGPAAGGGTTSTTGGIYEVTDGSPASAVLFVDVDADPSISTGPDPHPAPGTTCSSAAVGGTTNDNCWWHDSGAFPAVGKLGLGDLDFNADQTVLYTVNLNERTLIELPVGNPATVPATINAYSIPTNGCPGGQAVDARPFALAPHADDADRMYVGLTCSAEASQSAANMAVLVYEFDRGTGPGTESFTALSIAGNSLDYTRARELGNWGNCSGTCVSTWRPWLDDIAAMFVVQEGGAGTKQVVAHPQPLLSDIAFDGDDLLLAFRDRVSDQTPFNLGNPLDNTDPDTYDSWAAGELVRACADGSGGWTMESNAVCGGVTGAGQDNTDGPGTPPNNGEFYLDEALPGNFHHAELFLGGLAQLPGFGGIAATAYDLYAFNEGAIGTWNNAGGSPGSLATRARIYQSGGPPTFGKANGLGDLEALCGPPGLEIGNRVWCDSLANGVQDAGEAAGDGVDVVLNCGENDVVLTTDANGHYLFTDALYASVGGNSSQIPRNTACTISIDVTANAAALNGACGFVPTPTDANTGGSGAGSDLRDSDGGDLGGGLVGVVISTGDNGENDHSFDFGFKDVVPVELQSFTIN